jgi:hypothetical protein
MAGSKGAAAAPDRYELACEAASRLSLPLEPAELATLASDHDMGEAELSAIAVTLDYLAEKRRLSSMLTTNERSNDPS